MALRETQLLLQIIPADSAELESGTAQGGEPYGLPALHQISLPLIEGGPDRLNAAALLGGDRP